MSLLYNAGLWASLPPNGPEPPRGVLENPDAPIGDILLPQQQQKLSSASASASAFSSSSPSGFSSSSASVARLPLITLPARRAPPRRIRSFGDLGSADNLPDMEAAAAAISLKDEVEDEEEVVPLSPASSGSLHYSASSPALMRGRGGGGLGALPVAPTTPLASAAAAAAAASVFASVNAAAEAAAAAAAFDENNSSDDDSEEALVPGGGSGGSRRTGNAGALAAVSSATTTDYSSADMADGGGSGAWSSEDDTMEVDNGGSGNSNEAAAADADAAAAARRRPPLPPLPPTSSAAGASLPSSRRTLRVATGARTLGAPSPSAGQHKKPSMPAPRLPPPPRRALPPAAKPSLIDRVLLTEWADRAAAGLFRYDVAGLPTRLLLAPDGRGGGFVAQFNEGRLTKKRPTEFAKDAVVQAFDDNKFNFLKAAQKEVLFALARDGAPGTPATWSPEGAPCGPDPSLLLINVSPIEYGHVLLVPRVASRLPQLVDVESAALALRFAAEADNPYLRLCYNSLGAFGTVNHLHFQAYFLATPFAVEVAATAPLPPLPPRENANSAGGIGSSARFGVAPASLTAPRVSTTVGYPARALVFEATRGDLDGLAAALGDACSRLAAANVPHNVFVVDCGQRAFLFPNVFGTNKANGTVPEDLLDTQVDPACFELAGHMVFKRRSDFYDLAEGEAYNLVWRLLAAATPEPEEFARIVRLALAI